MSTCPTGLFRSHQAARDRARAAILARLADGPATGADLNKAAGLVDCEPHLRRLVNDGVVTHAVGRGYMLAGADARPAHEILAERIVEHLSDLSPQRLRDIVGAVGAPHSTVVVELRRLIDGGQVVRLAVGVYALAGAYPEGLPVSTRDPQRLTQGEAYALRYLCRRLVAEQALGVEDLERLAETVAADAYATAREAAATVKVWVEGLIAKGRIEVRGQRLVVLRDASGARVRLVLVAAGANTDEDDEDDDAPSEGLEGESPWRA